MRAADHINKSKFNVINVRHELGLFGEEYGSYLVKLLENNRKPTVVTLHTVISDPSPEMKRVMEDIGRYSNVLVVMISKAVEILRKSYNIKHKVRVIPHGLPDTPLQKDSAKKSLHLENKAILLTYGLMSPNKGIEYVIKAMPEIVRLTLVSFTWWLGKRCKACLRNFMLSGLNYVVRGYCNYFATLVQQSKALYHCVFLSTPWRMERYSSPTLIIGVVHPILSSNPA